MPSIQNLPSWPPGERGNIIDTYRAFGAAKDQVEGLDSVWDWLDDVEFLGASWVEFARN